MKIGPLFDYSFCIILLKIYTNCIDKKIWLRCVLIPAVPNDSEVQIYAGGGFHCSSALRLSWIFFAIAPLYMIWRVIEWQLKKKKIMSTKSTLILTILWVRHPFTDKIFLTKTLVCVIFSTNKTLSVNIFDEFLLSGQSSRRQKNKKLERLDRSISKVRQLCWINI